MLDWPPTPPDFTGDIVPPGGWVPWLIGAAALGLLVLLAAAAGFRRAWRGRDDEESPPVRRAVKGELVTGGAARVDARGASGTPYNTTGTRGGRDPSPPGLPPGQEPRLRRVRAVADFLDNSLKIPGVGYPIGWDAVIGMVPGVGDALTGTLAVWIIVQARALGVPKRKLVRMLANAGVDFAGGTLPGVGDLLDVAFKANRRNLRLIERHLAEGLRRTLES